MTREQLANQFKAIARDTELSEEARRVLWVLAASEYCKSPEPDKALVERFEATFAGIEHLRITPDRAVLLLAADVAWPL